MIRSNGKHPLISELAECMVNEVGFRRPPIDPFKAIEGEDILVIGNNYGEAFDGLIEWRGDHFNLYYNTKHGVTNDSRVRFSVSHEIGHAIIPWHRIFLQKSGQCHASFSGYISDNKMEREADEFAANLLMPLSMFKPATKGKPGLEIIIRGSQIFNASLLSTAVRYVNTTDFACVLLVSDGRKVRWYVKSDSFIGACASKLRPGYVFPDSSVTVQLTSGKIKPGRAEYIEDLIDVIDWFDSSKSLGSEILEQAIAIGRYGYLTLLCVEETD